MIGDKDHTSVVAENRLGMFIVGFDLLQVMSDVEIRAIFDGFLVVKAEALFPQSAVEYTAYHRQFDPIPASEITTDLVIPTYGVRFQLDDGVMKRNAIVKRK